MLGSSEESRQGQRRQAIENLRSHKVEILLRIIDELSDMDLTVREIETVLRTCGINSECANKFGTTIKAEKEQGRINPDRRMHP